VLPSKAVSHLQRGEDARTKWCHHRFRQLQKGLKSDLGETPFADLFLYGEEFKEIQSKTDNSKMPNSK
jgi:hypothetical protein